MIQLNNTTNPILCIVQTMSNAKLFSNVTVMVWIWRLMGLFKPMDSKHELDQEALKKGIPTR